jgi:hypothetical protein
MATEPSEPATKAGSFPISSSRSRWRAKRQVLRNALLRAEAAGVKMVACDVRVARADEEDLVSERRCLAIVVEGGWLNVIATGNHEALAAAADAYLSGTLAADAPR